MSCSSDRDRSRGNEADPPALPAFVDVTASSGIDFVHASGFDGRNYWSPGIVGAGCAVLDFDDDGWQDIFFVNGGSLTPDTLASPGWSRPPNALYRNRGDGTFEDVTARAGIAGAHYGQGCAVGDYDGDGDPDIYVVNVGPNELFRNEGNGTFVEVGAALGVNLPGWSATAAFGDLDADGDLDLFVGSYAHWSASTQVPCKSPSGEPDYCSPKVHEAAPDVYFCNVGNGRFEDRTRETGLAASYGHALGVVICDLNGDGHLDIYVANDSDPNILWQNRGNGTFVDDGLLSGAALNGLGAAEGSMGIGVADLENDDDLDLFLTHWTNETNTLYLNDGRGLFADASTASGLGTPSLPFTGFGTVLFDADLDGDDDVFVANGAVVKDTRADRSAWPYDELDQMYVGDRGVFRPLSTEEAPWLDVATVGRGAVAADLDEDGDLDLVVSNAGGRPRVLRNDSVRGDRHWLGVAVQGIDGNTEGVGAIVRLTTGTERRMQRIARDGSYASSTEPRAFFGFAHTPGSVGVSVQWLSGARETWIVDEVDRDIRLVQGTGTSDHEGVGSPLADAHQQPGEVAETHETSPGRLAAHGGLALPPPLPALDHVDASVAQRVQAAHDSLVASPEVTRAWVDYGVALYADVEAFEAAAVTLAEAVARDSTQALAAYLLALCEERLGRTTDARAAFVHVVTMEPTYRPARIRLANLDVETGRLDEAAAAYEVVRADAPDDPHALVGLGRIARARGDREAAMRWLERALAVAPESRAAHYEMGLALREADRLDEARVELETAASAAATGIDDPWLAQIHEGRGGASALLTDANRARVAGDLTTAHALYDRYTAEHPNDAIGWINLAAVRRDLGRRADALPAAARALELDASRGEAHALYGVLLAEEGRGPEAIASLREAVRLNPELAQAWFDLGFLLARSNRAAEAVPALESYIALRPNDVHGLVELGQALIATRQYDRARVRLEEAIALEPGEVTAHYRLAALAHQRAEPSAAIEHLARVLAARPTWPEAHFAAGMAHEMSGSPVAAREAFQRALELRPDSQRFLEAVVRTGGVVPDRTASQPRASALAP